MSGGAKTRYTRAVSKHLDTVKAVFDDWAQNGRADGMERGHTPVARRAFERLELAAGQRYLDIGCGNGYTVRWAAAVDPSVDANGLDLAPEMIDLAARKTEAANARFVVGAFPSPDLVGPFDAVFSMEVFYYLPDIDAALAAVYEALAPGGRLVSTIDFYRENRASHSWPEDTGAPMTLWSEVQWREAFERAGFRDVEQARLTQIFDPTSGAERSWIHDVGSLMTLGTR